MNNLYQVPGLLLLLGVFLITFSGRRRRARGLGLGQTLALDNVTLISERLGLIGRPDRLLRDGKYVIPEEWKSSRRVNQGHKLQLGAYFILIEEKYGVRPPYGFILLEDGSRIRVENTEGLGTEVLRIAQNIRDHRAKLTDEIPVRKPRGMCCACGQRDHCGQRTNK